MRRGDPSPTFPGEAEDQFLGSGQCCSLNARKKGTEWLEINRDKERRLVTKGTKGRTMDPELPFVLLCNKAVSFSFFDTIFEKRRHNGYVSLEWSK